jgi:hypothetical protein
VERLRRKRFEDEQIERALEKVGREFIFAIVHIDDL